MRIFFYLMYALGAWKWAKWRNWQKYCPTYLFMIAIDFSASILMYHHTLWHFEPSFLLPNHTITDFFAAFVVYPSTVLLYLSRYPTGSSLKQFAWISIWVSIYSVHETLSYYSGLMTYEHGWFLGSSFLFNLAMFPIYLNPGLAFTLAVLMAFVIFNYFGFSLQELK